MFSNIRNKIVYNPSFTQNYLILAGHFGITTIGQLPRLERRGLWLKSPSILLKASGSSSSTSKGLIDT
ncbi:MAG: hypothetical protein BAJALOKI1v1_430001 [Promethearchaeota archaeon]|nr:MAG: hypothetical protein BAJALOKI1v1_430001 [Candidatus Lokiarchaeota archaeon]